LAEPLRNARQLQTVVNLNAHNAFGNRQLRDGLAHLGRPAAMST
jgi:hypothetical protein